MEVLIKLVTLMVDGCSHGLTEGVGFQKVETASKRSFYIILAFTMKERGNCCRFFDLCYKIITLAAVMGL